MSRLQASSSNDDLLKQEIKYFEFLVYEMSKCRNVERAKSRDFGHNFKLPTILKGSVREK